MRLSIKEVNTILQAEIDWCLDHPDPLLNRDQQMGFMNGLRQAQILIRNAESKLDIFIGQGFSEHEPDYSEGEWK